jgi:recombination protein RecR
VRLKEEVASCARCRNLSDKDPCSICSDPRRDSACLCVVETPADLAAMESAGTYQGLYYVLAGPMAPMRGIGPDQLRLGGLLKRIKDGQVKEVIIATNPTTEGEATADLLCRELSGSGVNLSRLGYGMPVGGDLKYMDGLTLKRSLESRRKMD